jgi:choline dehydrogenase-like flavoprotein
MVALPRSAVSQARIPDRVSTRATLHGDTVLDADVVIVGSGAGGATLAAELAEHGLDVVMIEEGRYFTTRDFTAEASAMTRQLYRDGGASLAIGDPPVMFQEGRAVGGSTVINGGMSWRTPERILERWRREAGLDHIEAADMEPYFERVERRINVRHQDPDSIGKDNELLKRGADAKGWKVIPNLRNQVHCAGSNNCAFGCPTGAKQSALVSYVPRALHFGARLLSDVKIDKILMHGKRAVGVQGHVVGGDGQRGHRVVVRGKLVVSACGAIQTPALLARSGVRTPSGQLGRNLSLHPNVKVTAVFDEPVRGWEGVHQAYQVREFEGEGLLFAAVNIPPGVIAMTSHARGAELGRQMAEYDRTVIAGMLCEDTATGRVRTIGGRPQAFYQLAQFDAEKLIRGVALLSELLFAAGARSIETPFSGVPALRSHDDTRALYARTIKRSAMEVVTVHMMGTAAMGSDRTRSVTDDHGLVHDADRLMVCDASLFPTPIGVNPMETIMALATRAAAHVLDNLERYR